MSDEKKPSEEEREPYRPPTLEPLGSVWDATGNGTDFAQSYSMASADAV